jgi:DNA-binding transcriptional LysR family regulator
LFRSLQYFEAVARYRSFKLAADDLGVTGSAVSHQMRRFSDAVGHQLLVKSGRGIALTAKGEELAAKLTSVFGGLETLVKGIAGGGQDALQLPVCSTDAQSETHKRCGECQEQENFGVRGRQDRGDRCGEDRLDRVRR